MNHLSSIRARLTLGFTAAAAALMLLAAGGLIAYSRHAAARSADLLLNATARKVLLQLSPRGADPDQMARPQPGAAGQRHAEGDAHPDEADGHQDETGNHQDTAGDHQDETGDHPNEAGRQQADTDNHQVEAGGPQSDPGKHPDEAGGQPGGSDNPQGQADWQHVELSELIEQDRQDLQSSNLAMLIVNPDGRVGQRSQARIPAWPRRDGDPWRTVAVPFGAHTIVIGLPWASTAERLNDQALILLLLCLFGIAVAAAGSWLLVGRTLPPIGALSRQARSASAESLRVSLRAPSPDAEVVELVATLNALLARLADTAAVKGRFYAAASHELRTPLQALTGHLDLALSRPRTNDEYRAAMVEAREQARLLTSLARALLWLHQLETAPRLPPAEPVDLAELCERLLSSFDPLIRQRGLRVQTGPWVGAVIQAPRSHAEMLIRNLIENAVKYASPGGALRLELVMAGTAPELVIFNESLAALPAEQRFEPFFRPDSSRTAGTGGNGLGLAICKAITESNRWQLTWLPEAQGVRVTVAFGPLRSV